MSYNVYLTGVGVSPIPATDVLKSNMPLEKVYILNNSTKQEFLDSEAKIRFAFKSANVREIITLKIDPYDFNSIVESILKMASAEMKIHPDVKFHMNFTSGTRIMSGAITCAAMMLNADLCYVKNADENPELKIEDQVIFIHPANMVESRTLTGELKKVFLKVASNPEGIENSDISPEIKRNTLTYHTKKLVKMGLIENRSDGRSKRWFLTEKGRSTKAIMSIEE